MNWWGGRQYLMCSQYAYMQGDWVTFWRCLEWVCWRKWAGFHRVVSAEGDHFLERKEHPFDTLDHHPDQSFQVPRIMTLRCGVCKILSDLQDEERNDPTTQQLSFREDRGIAALTINTPSLLKTALIEGLPPHTKGELGHRGCWTWWASDLMVYGGYEWV